MHFYGNVTPTISVTNTFPDLDADHFAAPLLVRAMQSNACLWKVDQNVAPYLPCTRQLNKANYETFLKYMEQAGWRRTVCYGAESLSVWSYVDPIGIVAIIEFGPGYAPCGHALRFNAEDYPDADAGIKAIQDAAAKWLTLSEEIPKQVRESNVHMLVYRGGSLTTQTIPHPKVEYVPENYTLSVRKKWEHVLEELKSPIPKARLAILNGPPGTGKTHLIKALLGDDGIEPLLVPNTLFSRLGDPDFVGTMFSFSQGVKYNSRYPVLILEDADELLHQRDKASSINPLATLLNISDGIVGASLDIRIVLTTNAHGMNFDKAVLRNGRCLEHIEVSALPRDLAQARLYALLKEKLYEHDAVLSVKEFLGANTSPTIPLCDIYMAALEFEQKHAEAGILPTEAG